MAFGWSNVFGKIFDWIPGKEEYLRNKKQKLERERDSILAKKTLTGNDSAHLGYILVELHKVQTQLENK